MGDRGTAVDLRSEDRISSGCVEISCILYQRQVNTFNCYFHMAEACCEAVAEEMSAKKVR